MKRLAKYFLVLILAAAVAVSVMPNGMSVKAAVPETAVVTVEKGANAFRQNHVLFELQSIMPDMSLRPATNPWTDKVNNMWGIGLNSYHGDIPFVASPDPAYPYMLVGNGLCSRIKVQFDGIIPRSVEGRDLDLTDPEVIKNFSIDVAGQYKLQDAMGNVYYTYCCDVATDASLGELSEDGQEIVCGYYNGANIEDAGYYSETDAKHIRYICMYGYWGAAEGVGSMDAFKALLKENNVLTDEELDALTPGECMTATQAAVWKFGNSDLSFKVDSQITGPALKNYNFGSNDWDWLEEYKAGGDQIQKMYDFLIQGTLNRNSKITIATLDNSISDVNVMPDSRITTGADTGRDIYKSAVYFKTDLEIGDHDELEVKISQNNALLATVPLVSGQSEYIVEDLELMENEDIGLVIEGNRHLAWGVYIFTAKDPSIDQTLVGPAIGTQRVGHQRDLRFNVSYEAEAVVAARKTLSIGELKDAQFTFQLIDSEGNVIDEATNAADGTITFKALRFTTDDLGDSSEKTIAYTVKEIAGDEKGISYDTSEKTVHVKLSIDGDDFNAAVLESPEDIEFVNKVETVEVPVTKTWKDDADNDGKRPASITVNLLADGEKIDSAEITEKDGWKHTFTDLPKYRDGKEIEYTVTEEEVTDYTAEIIGYDITNTHDNELTEVEGKKTWDDDDDKAGLRPDSITINLLADGEKMDSVTVTEKEEWAWSWKDLPKYKDGKEIEYTVTEDEVEWYEAAVDGFDVTNKVVELVSVEGVKTWDDNDNENGLRPASININLFADGEKVDSVTVTEEDDWSWSWENLPKTKDGKEIEYTITEDEVDGYIAKVIGYDVINSRIPDTGDHNGAWEWAGLALAAALCIEMLRRRRTE